MRRLWFAPLMLAVLAGSSFSQVPQPARPIPAAKWIVLDPSGQSRPVMIVADGVAFTVASTPIITGDLPPAPAPPPTDPTDPPPVADVFGFKAVAASSTVILNAEQRTILATTYEAIASRADEFSAIGAMQTALNEALAEAIPDMTPYRPVFTTLHLHLTGLWNTSIKTPADLAQAFREIAAGAKGTDF